MTARATAPWPLVGASVALFADGKVLLAQRGRGWRAGAWSLPGGRVEPGETLAEAALRETREEIGVEAALIGFVDHVEVIERDDAGAILAHFLVCAFAGRIAAGEPRLSPECTGLTFVDPAAPGARELTPGLAPLLLKAAALVEARG